MPQLILFNKPFNVLSQFSGAVPEETLAHYLQAPGFYPAGRLDKDSEGLLLLTDCGETQQRISNPRHKLGKVYWSQVEGQVTEEALLRLRQGVNLKDGLTRPAGAERLTEPSIWGRSPPIRERKLIPTSWLALTLYEGRNRQVRRMTAAVGFPTLRLVRQRIGNWQLDDLLPGDYKTITLPARWWQ
ncbi:MAG: pseudouridine synthase [Pseudohongiella sp.]|uniref:pseudouridine synthase n=1 Tax=Pseudohongiella sp. TaxID=1979412 RepID=UPI00349FF780